MSSRKVLIEAEAREYVGYFGIDGQQIDRGYPLEERPQEPPTGVLYEQEYVLLKEATDENGEPIERLNGFPLRAGPRKFLRGHIVHMPPILQELASVLGAHLGVEGSVSTTAVVAKKANGTEGCILLQADDIPPPEGSSEYAVGESPEERRMAEMVSEAAAYAEGCQEDLDLEDEVGQIREAVKNGDVECILPFPDRDDGPRVA